MDACNNDSINDYAKPSLTTDMVLYRIKEKTSDDIRRNAKQVLEILLIKRDTEPYKGKLSLPGGFVDIDEGIVGNVKRKLKEKTGIGGEFYIEQLCTKGAVDRDPRGRVISISYLGLGNAETIVYGADTEGECWYDVTEILRGLHGELSFDHKEIIEYSLERLQNKVEHTDIAFNLVGKEFTISEIKQVYEILLGREILNFRRKIKEYVKPLGKKTDGKQHRPAEIYTLNKNRRHKF